MIRRVYVDNFKCLVNFELRLQPLSLLMGASGVGKSSVLDVVAALARLLNGTAKVADPECFPGSSCTRWQQVAVQIVELEVELSGTMYVYRLEIEHEVETRRARVLNETLRLSTIGSLFSFRDGDVQLFWDDGSPGPIFPADPTESGLARVAPRANNQKLTNFLSFVRSMTVCALYPRSFTSESPGEMAQLSRDGSNFASWYRHMLLERQELVPAFLEDLRAVMPEFSSIRLQRVGTEARAVMLSFRRQNGSAGKSYELRLDELSDGQRALIVLYALVHFATKQATTIFLDEPDNYVPLAELQPWLVALSDAVAESEGQVVVCSHHPELIDYLGPESGLLLVRQVTGVTSVVGVREMAGDEDLNLSEAFARGWHG
jgi:predicted ATPase